MNTCLSTLMKQLTTKGHHSCVLLDVSFKGNESLVPLSFHG